MLTDLEIAQQAKLKPILEVAELAGIKPDELDLYGKYKAKVSLDILKRLAKNPDAKYIDVTAITPTPLGEGKTVIAIGLAQAFWKIGKRSILCLREPSMGPVFGIKGGATGGGYSQVVPMEDINLHFTGDIHAVGAANNLLAAMIDTHILKGNKLGIDPLTISFRRCVDISDRALRDIVIGLGGRENGYPRQTGYDITVASEVMAILALTTGLEDLRKRLASITIGSTYDGKPVTAEDLNAAGAMTVLMKEAIKPNLVQTLENTPTFVHAGPFANIAHGNNSVIADQIAIKLGEYLVTESGFGADCGMEKFFDIKCRVSGLIPNLVIITASIRALKMHGGGITFIPGRPVDKAEVAKENLPALDKGCENLQKQIENALLFGVPTIVAINKFDTDTPAELDLVKRRSVEFGAEDAILVDCWAKGGEGAIELAEAAVEACKKPIKFKFLYPLDMPIKEKIETIATKVYGAEGVEYAPLAEQRIKLFTQQGLDKLPINMAKTHLSLSHDPNLKGRPREYVLPIRDIRPSTGAGFLYPLCGVMQTMPGLPTRPAAVDVDIDETGKTVGLF